MELTLQPIATKCCVSGREFRENDRVVSYLVRLSAGPGPGGEASGGVVRRDVLESEDTGVCPSATGPELVEPAFVYCRWVVVFKPRKPGENPALALKLTAENLFLTLASPGSAPGDPAGEADAVAAADSGAGTAANVPLLQFLALLLERKKLIKARGLTGDGQRQIYEHMATHRFYEVPAGDLDEEFFRNIQEHLGVLVGGPKPKPEAAAPAG